ncbi:MAG: hypothetical protein AUJ75_00780 [Candidatus Omnitrophica bacterium CG1_02_49_10]|nr:MAG: hypothetical protein AUJ75_00780 [Candidatus Omnitrophica bacterium CG1_02_49_10]
MLSALDKKIVNTISRDIPLAREPFKVLSQKIGISQSALLDKVRSYKKSGIMRKLSASINHRKAGFKYNAMVAWNISSERIDAAAEVMVSLPEVTHCYRRKKAPDWRYNLYAMIHGATKKACLRVVDKISRKTGDKDYRVLFSLEEYKKSGARYFER